VSNSSESNINWFPNQKAPVITIDEYPNDIDILIATAWSTAFVIAELKADRKFYFVQSDETRFHEPDSPWEKITRLSYLMDYEYITEARWIQTWLKEQFNKDSGLVPNGLDPEIYHEVEPLVPKGSKPRILLEGAIGLPYKGMAQAFEAVKNIDAEIWCVSSYGRVKADWKCDRFFESVPMSEMKKIYSSCEILLKLSRVEGFFGPPMEMMACGGAVIVGKVTGYDEYIVDNENALVVDPFDIKGAEDAVRKLIEDKDLYRTLVENGKRTSEQWSWETSLDKLEEIIKNPARKSSSIPENNLRLNRSISFFYETMLKNYDMFCADKAEKLLGQPASYERELAEKLCIKLKAQSWFYTFSKLVYKAYSLSIRVRRFVSLAHIWYLNKLRPVLGYIYNRTIGRIM
jgi:O-antigen biosynthesis protein